MINRIRKQTVQVIKGSNNKRMLIEAHPDVVAALEQSEKKHGCVFPAERAERIMSRANPALLIGKICGAPAGEKKVAGGKAGLHESFNNAKMPQTMGNLALTHTSVCDFILRGEPAPGRLKARESFSRTVIGRVCLRREQSIVLQNFQTGGGSSTRLEGGDQILVKNSKRCERRSRI
jgi:hypothetical protein